MYLIKVFNDILGTKRLRHNCNRCHDDDYNECNYDSYYNIYKRIPSIPPIPPGPQPENGPIEERIYDTIGTGEITPPIGAKSFIIKAWGGGGGGGRGDGGHPINRINGAGSGAGGGGGGLVIARCEVLSTMVITFTIGSGEKGGLKGGGGTTSMVSSISNNPEYNFLKAFGGGSGGDVSNPIGGSGGSGYGRGKFISFNIYDGKDGTNGATIGDVAGSGGNGGSHGSPTGGHGSAIGGRGGIGESENNFAENGEVPGGGGGGSSFYVAPIGKGANGKIIITFYDL